MGILGREEHLVRGGLLGLLCAMLRDWPIRGFLGGGLAGECLGCGDIG